MHLIGKIISLIFFFFTKFSLLCQQCHSNRSLELDFQPVSEMNQTNSSINRSRNVFYFGQIKIFFYIKLDMLKFKICEKSLRLCLISAKYIIVLTGYRNE